MRKRFIIRALTPASGRGSLTNYLWVDEAAPGAAGFNGTAVGGLRAAFAESAELRIFAASCTDRSKPASFTEYLYFSRRMFDTGVGTGTKAACSCTMRVK